MTRFWRYMVHCFEHSYDGRYGRWSWFWTLSWFLHDAGVIRGAEGGYWRDAEWHWRFWEPRICDLGRHGIVVISWCDWWKGRRFR